MMLNEPGEQSPQAISNQHAYVGAKKYENGSMYSKKLAESNHYKIKGLKQHKAPTNDLNCTRGKAIQWAQTTNKLHKRQSHTVSTNNKQVNRRIMIEHNQEQELHRTSWTSIVFKGRKRKKQEQTKQSAEDNFNKCPSVFWQDCQKRPERKVWEVKTNILIMKKKTINKNTD